jgi:hypothetical protein
VRPSSELRERALDLAFGLVRLLARAWFELGEFHDRRCARS